MHTPSSSSSICYELRLFAIVTNNIYLHRYYKCDYFLFISVMFVFLWSNSSMRKLDLFAAERQYLSHNASNLFISFDKNPIFCIFFLSLYLSNDQPLARSKCAMTCIIQEKVDNIKSRSFSNNIIKLLQSLELFILNLFTTENRFWWRKKQAIIIQCQMILYQIEMNARKNKRTMPLLFICWCFFLVNWLTDTSNAVAMDVYKR